MRLTTQMPSLLSMQNRVEERTNYSTHTMQTKSGKNISREHGRDKIDDGTRRLRMKCRYLYFHEMETVEYNSDT